MFAVRRRLPSRKQVTQRTGKQQWTVRIAEFKRSAAKAADDSGVYPGYARLMASGREREQMSRRVLVTLSSIMLVGAIWAVSREQPASQRCAGPDSN